MRKYFHRFKNRLEVAVLYRFNIVGEIVLQLFMMTGYLVLWLYIYRDNDGVSGLDLDSLVSYYVFIPLSGVIFSTDLSSSLGRDIKDGFLSAELLKPNSIWLSYLFNDLARKFYEFVLICGFYVLLTGILEIFVLDFEFEVAALAVTLVFAVFGIALRYVMELSTAYLAFWVDEVWAFKHVRYVLDSILGGRAFPFGLLSSSLFLVFNLLPFKFFFFVPLSYALNQRQLDSVPFDLVVLAVWFLVFVFLAWFLWNKGIAKYGAYGN